MMLFKSKKLLGLDLGTTSIKAVELDVSSKGAALKTFGVHPTPASALSGGEVQDPNNLASSISTLVADIGSKRKKVSTSMWGTSVVVKKITMPKMDPNLLREQIRWEAEQYIPLDINEINLEFVPLTTAGSSDSMDVLLVAAKSDLMMRYVDVVNLSGLTCSVLDVTGFALANCFDFNYGTTGGQVALLNVGASSTNFVVVERGIPVFTRDIPVGGLTYNSYLQSEMGVSAEEAESLKVSSSLSQPVPDDVHRIMSSTTDMLCREIQNSFDFYSTTFQTASLSKFFLTGGSSNIRDLITRISKTLDIPGEQLDPLRRVTVSQRNFSSDYLNQIRPFLAVAIGLGLRTEDDRK